MKMQKYIEIILLLVLTPTLLQANPIKKGRVLCEGSACGSHDGETNVGRTITPVEMSNPTKPKDNGGLTEIGHQVRISVSNKSTSGQSHPTKSNLPQYYSHHESSDPVSSDEVVYVAKNGPLKPKGLKSGDLLRAIIDQEITASSSVPTPIRAIVIMGEHKGGILLGEAVLDRELKRVLLTFSKLKLKDQEEVYLIRASGLSMKGSVGLEGDYSTQSKEYFVAELASAAAAGLVDATINRNQTVQGGYVQEPSITNASKNAAVSALSKTTERMAEGARSAPEFTRIDGHQEIQVLLQDDPIQAGT